MEALAQFGALPKIQTRKALLLLDFQNDFVRSNGALHVPTIDFLETIPQLVESFRSIGDVFWVRSHYDSRRPIVDPDTGNRLVVGPAENEGDSQGDSDGEAQVDEEAFLSTNSPTCCEPGSAGAQFPAPIFAAIDADSDTLLDKSDYSALRDDGLISSFRSRLITEVYLCGSLSNVSVYATALDAARHGFSVTLIEDCLGYRSFARHEEAIRQMADVLGVSGITTEELYEEIDWQETDAIARRGNPRSARPVAQAGIEGVLDGLDVKTSPKAHAAETKERPGSSRGRRLQSVLAELTDDEDGNLKELARLTQSRYSPSAQQEPTTAEISSPKARLTKRTESKSTSETGKQRRRDKNKLRELGPGDSIGEGDSRIVYDLDLPTDAFEKIRDEVAWQKMYHMSGQVPRLVAVQGLPLKDGSVPIYRHPADESPSLRPYTPMVDQARVIVERILGHPLNHVLIQLYRDGQDRISEHSDKTLDIVRGSYICNVSLGAQRLMVLRTKTREAGEEDAGRQTQRVPMPHESLFVLGEQTNMRWLHGIRPDKRQESTKSVEERAYGGERISLTFRHIGTFLNSEGDIIWGQGAVSKSQEKPGKVIHGDPAETERLIRAFGKENHSTEFDWDGVYGGGFDGVNFVTAESAQLILSGDSVSDLRVRLALGENGLRYEVVHSSKDSGSADGNEKPVYTAPDGTKVAGDVNILTHLSQMPPPTTRPGANMLRGGSQLPDIEDLLKTWRDLRAHDRKDDIEALQQWEDSLKGKQYLGGPTFQIEDCSLWPVLRDIVQKRGLFPAKKFPNLHHYYQRVENRGVVKITLEEMG